MTGARVRVDICFTRGRVAVFVDGCFWHVCPLHHKPPKKNTNYWAPKLAANIARDRRNDAGLAGDGWLVVRVWEHEAIVDAADRVEIAVSGRLDER